MKTFAEAVATLSEHVNVRDVYGSTWRGPSWSKQVDWGAGVYRVENLQFSCIKEKTGLREAAKQTETAWSPTDMTSWGDGCRADGSESERRKAELQLFMEKQADFDRMGSQTESTAAAWAIASRNSLAASHDKHTEFGEVYFKIRSKTIKLFDGLCHI